MVERLVLLSVLSLPQTVSSFPVLERRILAGFKSLWISNASLNFVAFLFGPVRFGSPCRRDVISHFWRQFNRFVRERFEEHRILYF